jgi:nucleotide-binding universal stress UspA family protein
MSTGRTHPAEPGHHRYGRIVVGVDGSEGSKGALRWAACQAELTGASLEVVMAWEVPVIPYGVWTGHDAGGQTQEALDDAVQEVVDEPNQVHVVTTAIEGRPELALLEAAEKADLLVVGSRGHRALAGLLLGPVSRHCVTHASCPVVVVPRCQ